MPNNLYLEETRIRGGAVSNTYSSPDKRNAFESDFGRITFCSATRRMHDKTQVFPLSFDDNIHTRLTHSLEVMTLGESFGIRLSEDEGFLKFTGLDKLSVIRKVSTVIKNACLIHDIGNPPFGHFGEEVIQKYFTNLFSHDASLEKKIRKYDGLTQLEKEDFKFFDGNAQGFRVVTKLQKFRDVFGLNLSIPTLAAYLKYPNSSALNGTRLETKKRGVFQSEESALEMILDKANLVIDGEAIRHPLCYLMEASDSICYLVMDIEDGFKKGYYTFASLSEQLKGSLSDEEDICELLDRIDTMASDGEKMIQFRIDMISVLMSLALGNFLQNLSDIGEGKYNKELIKDGRPKIEKALSKFCVTNVFRQREITDMELTGAAVIQGLLDYHIKYLLNDDLFLERTLSRISTSIVEVALDENDVHSFSDLPQYYKLRVIVDYISGMTDKFALDEYQRLSGHKI